jgi:hypothetical protein
MFKLTIEPIAQCNWGVSLAHYLPKEVWDTLRKEVYTRAKYTCEICEEADVEFHCHEVWEYLDIGVGKKGVQHVQRLKKLQCICVNCHYVKHWGGTVARVHKKELPTDTLKLLTEHFCTVNGCTPAEFLEYRVYMGEVSQVRARIKYELSWGKYEPKKAIDLWAKENKGK